MSLDGQSILESLRVRLPDNYKAQVVHALNHAAFETRVFPRGSNSMEDVTYMIIPYGATKDEIDGYVNDLIAAALERHKPKGDL